MSDFYNQISSLVWNSVDRVIRDIVKKNEVGKYILPFVVLRRFDFVLDKDKEEVIKKWNNLKKKGVKDPSKVILTEISPRKFFNISKFDLKKLSQDSKMLKENFNNYLLGYSENVQKIFENFKVNELIEHLDEENVLLEFIQEFTKKDINLSPEKIDNHSMGLVYEEILNKFSEDTNTSSGEYYTPRDVIKLLVELILEPEKDKLNKNNLVRSIYDPCCGTGGMLTISRDWAKKNLPKNMKLRLSGQEITKETHSICQSDFLILDEDPDEIIQGSTLSNDGFKKSKFYYMISNPPFGKHWGTEKNKIEFQNDLNDIDGPYQNGLPPVRDSQTLFIMKLISKMEPKGSRIGVITNGSPLFTDEPSESSKNISDFRKSLVDSDLLEAVIKLPLDMFFDTNIHTYIWILNNKKEKDRIDKIQLINATNFYEKLGRSLNKKTNLISEKNKNEILNIYLKQIENDFSKIIDKKDFLYTRIKVDYPLMEHGKPVLDNKGKQKIISEYERIPFGVDVNDYFENEIKKYIPTGTLDKKKIKIGCEITFNKYFYNYEEPQESKEVLNDIMEIDKEINETTKKILR